MAYRYEVARVRLASDVPVSELASFAVEGPAEAPPPSATAGAPVNPGEETLIFRGQGWVGGLLRRVESRIGPAGYRLRIEGAGEFSVVAGGTIERRQDGPAADPLTPRVVAAALGPCLLLALAMRGTWCLHAAAAGAGRAAVALSGESGCGKSTLAAALASGAVGWRRIADDLLPVALEADAPVALPRFPQPKLEPGGQWRRPAPDQLALAAVYLLEPGGDRVELDRLSARAAALALVRQTVAARLFAADLQAEHFEFCAALARRLPVYSLRFPRRPEVLPAMVAAIAGGSPAPC